MLLKDLQNMNKSKDAKRRVLGKVETEMIYYFTMKNMLRKYGIPFKVNSNNTVNYSSGSTEIAVMNFDALGCVRDQMAMACSDNGAVTYNSEGDVLKYDVDSVITNSILNSESLLKLVQAYIADNSDEAIDSDTLYEMAVKRLKEETEIDRERSIAALVKKEFETLQSGSRTNMFGMYDKNAFDGDGNRVDQRNLVKLPLSPFMPEFEKLHKITSLDAGYGTSVSFRVFSRFMQSVYNPNVSYGYAMKENLGTSVDACYSYDLDTGVLSDGFSYDIRSSKQGKRNQKQVSKVVIDNDAFSKHNSLDYYTTTTAVKNSFIDKLSINIYNVLTKYSQRELTDEDLALIPVLSENVLNDMLGNPEEGLQSMNKIHSSVELKSMELTEKEYFDIVCDHIDEFIEDYTSYIETACKHMRDNIHHHEFQIHLQDVTSRYAIATKGEVANASGKNSVIALYASGDSRGHDYNVAKNQESRFFAVVAHAKYNKRNSAIQPVFGDILGAGYESYAIGDVNQHSKDEENIVSGFDAIRRAKTALLAYDQKKTDMFTIIRAASDVENFVNDDGTIAAEALMQTLRDDRDAISAKMQIRFSDDLVDVKQACDIALRSIPDMDSISSDSLKHIITNAIQVLSIEKFESQINDQIVYRHLHDNFINNIFEKLDNLSKDMSSHELIENLRNIINDVDTEQSAKIACEELFGSNDLICVDKCSQYSAIPYINQIVQLASNLRQCQYVSDMQDLKTRQLDNLGSSVNYLYFTTFTKDMSVDEDAKVDSISGVSDDDTANDALENDVEDNVSTVDDAKYRSMFLNPSDDDITWSWISSNDRDAIVYRATHPLQYRVFREVRNGVNNANIKMTKNGIIYYADEHEVKFKVGPIVDEEAFIMPVLQDGTKTSEIVIENNELKNQIRFGALDLKSVGNSSVNNRIYGYSGVIDSYDGYSHSDNFTDRISLSTYQMSVMDEVKKCLNLYSIAFDYRSRHRNQDGYNIKKNVYMYYQHNFINNVYNTGTYIIENKEKAEIASRYLSNLVHFADELEKNPFEGIIDYDAINSDEFFETPEFKSALELHLQTISENDDMDIATTEFKELYRAGYIDMLEDAVVRSVQTYMMQLDMDHSRCVMPKITLEQNIGLYNVALNLGENNMTKSVGKIDRKNLRDSDCKSRRIVGFQDNSKFDAKLTGSAKRLGAILYLAEETEVDRITGKIREHGGHYSSIINSGIKDVTGEVVAPVVSFNGGQALDRIQLSVYAQLKGLTYASDTNFAMINLTDNMEDGYIITKRIAKKFGHFEYNEKTDTFEYITAVVGDKIGDSESGNKGIISRIIDTDMSREEFIADETRKFFIAHAVSNDDTFDSKSVEQILAILNDYIGNDIVKYDAKNMMDVIKLIESQDNRDDIYNKLFEASDTDALSIPKYESCIHNRLAQFLIFKNNPELDVAMTNVCVLTRSNPSLLMHIDDKELVIEDTHTGEKQTHVGGMGTCMFYLDSHTATDKNRRYSDYGAVKGGRSYGAQEMFALDARKCNDEYVKLLITQDKYIVSKLSKLNRRLIMNGLYIDAGDDFKLKTVVDNKYVVDGDSIVDQNGVKFANASETQVLDMRELAKKMLEAIDINLNQSDKNIYKYTASMINGELQYGIFNSVVAQSKSRESADKEQSIQSANNLIDAWFSYITNVPNTFISISQSMPEDLFRVYYNSIFTPSDEIDDYTLSYDLYEDDDEFMEDVYDDPYYDPMVYDSDEFEFLGYATKELWERRADALAATHHNKLSLLFNLDGKDYMPLFTSYEYNSSSEDDSGISIAKAKTKTQMNIFKNILAYCVLEELEDRRDKIDGYENLSSAIDEAKKYIKNRLVTICSNISKDNSLTLDDLNSKFKSDIYRFTVSNSYTAVWSGDGGSLNLNQVGISFEMAKEMNLIHRTSKEPMKYPDTFENMILNGYSQIKEDELVFVNRSPGQTTGCMRGLHPVIINNDSRSIKIHPAIATVFDGDFDGDTVGVIHIPKTKKNFEVYENAMNEAHRTMTLETNIIKTAENKVVMSKSGEPIKYVNPLFIAGNADIGIGLYYAQQQRTMNSSDVKISDELDDITIKANLLEQYKQLANDLQSSLMYGDAGANTQHDTNAMCVYTPTIIRERLEQINNLTKYSDEIAAFNEELSKNSCKGLLEIVHSYLDCVDEVTSAFEDAEKRKEDMKEKANESDNPDEEMLKLFMGSQGDKDDQSLVSTKLIQHIKELHEDFASGGDKAKSIEKAQSAIYALELDNYEHLNDIYTEAMSVSNGKCFTAGKSAYEKIEKIVAEANISRKGKAPQLNALLKYSGLYDVLRVDKDKETGKFALFNADGTKITEAQREKYCEVFEMDVTKAKADVPVSEHRNENQSNMTAQSDKADATGLGGAVAQKMQKFMSSFGYSEVALMISGPITQRYLDAKQNVAACEINLTVGKYVLDDVMSFKRVVELSNDEFKKYDFGKTRNGQFTTTGEAVSVNEGVDQINNLIKMMDLTSDGLEALSPVNQAIVKACAASVIGANGDYDAKVTQFAKNCEEKNSQAYRIMYNSNSAKTLISMAEEGTSIFEGMMMQNAQSQLVEKMDEKSVSADTKMHTNIERLLEVTKSNDVISSEKEEVKTIAGTSNAARLSSMRIHHMDKDKADDKNVSMNSVLDDLGKSDSDEKVDAPKRTSRGRSRSADAKKSKFISEHSPSATQNISGSDVGDNNSVKLP